MALQPVLDIQEVARVLGLKPGTVYRLVRRGEIPGFKIGGQWRFNEAVLESWMAERTRARKRSHRHA